MGGQMGEGPSAWEDDLQVEDEELEPGVCLHDGSRDIKVRDRQTITTVRAVEPLGEAGRKSKTRTSETAIGRT